MTPRSGGDASNYFIYRQREEKEFQVHWLTLLLSVISPSKQSLNNYKQKKRDFDMNEIDIFASELFEEAKRFLEKAREDENKEGQKAYLHAALLLGMSSLEAHINAISEEM